MNLFSENSSPEYPKLNSAVGGVEGGVCIGASGPVCSSPAAVGADSRRRRATTAQVPGGLQPSANSPQDSDWPTGITAV